MLKLCFVFGVHCMIHKTLYLYVKPCVCVDLTLYRLAIIVWGNGLSLVRCQAITWTIANILANRPTVTKTTEIWIKRPQFSFKQNAFENVFCKMVAIIFRSQCVKCLEHHDITFSDFSAGGEKHFTWLYANLDQESFGAPFKYMNHFYLLPFQLGSRV